MADRHLPIQNIGLTANDVPGNLGVVNVREKMKESLDASYLFDVESCGIQSCGWMPPCMTSRRQQVHFGSAAGRAGGSPARLKGFSPGSRIQPEVGHPARIEITRPGQGPLARDGEIRSELGG